MPDITHQIDAALLSELDSEIYTIVILVNGYHWKFYYLGNSEWSPSGYELAKSDGRVLLRTFQLKTPGSIRLSDIPVLEAELDPLLRRINTGYGLVWNGEAHVAYLSADARSALDDIDSTISRFELRAPARDLVSDPPAALTHIVLDADWKTRMARESDSLSARSVAAQTDGQVPGQPILSLVIGVFNKSKYISECLHSVLGQGIEDIEIICVDDASTDNSAEVVASIARTDPRLRLIRNERNLGAGPTRNIGLTEARGRYVMFVDGDDLLAPQALTRLLAEVAACDADLVRGGIAFHFDGVEPPLRIADTPPDRRTYVLSDEPHLWIPWWFTTYLYRRDFLLENQLKFPALKDGEDPVFLAGALTAAQCISSISETVYYYRRHGGHSRDDHAFLAQLVAVRDIFEKHDPRVWKDGYGMYVLVNDLPRRILAPRNTQAERRENLRNAIVALNMFPAERFPPTPEAKG